MYKEMVMHFIRTLEGTCMTQDEVISSYVWTVEDIIEDETQLLAVFHTCLQVMTGLIAARRVESVVVHGVDSLRLAAWP
jgi:hypothetical protein